MEKLLIEGGRELVGEVRVSGAKNAALPLLAATLLAPGTHELTNVPDLRDTRTILAIISELGCVWRRQGSTLYIDSTDLVFSEVSYDLVKTMRASVLVLGPLLARLGRAKVSLPGGCAIGERPINFHIRGFERLGVRCTLENGYVDARRDDDMRGSTIHFDIPSVTGTENILMSAVLAAGKTVIKNAAREPEVANLIEMLIAMGGLAYGFYHYYSGVFQSSELQQQAQLSRESAFTAPENSIAVLPFTDLSQESDQGQFAADTLGVLGLPRHLGDAFALGHHGDRQPRQPAHPPQRPVDPIGQAGDSQGKTAQQRHIGDQPMVDLPDAETAEEETGHLQLLPMKRLDLSIPYGPVWDEVIDPYRGPDPDK